MTVAENQLIHGVRRFPFPGREGQCPSPTDVGVRQSGVALCAGLRHGKKEPGANRLLVSFVSVLMDRYFMENDIKT